MSSHDPTGAVTKRGPITRIHNGRGVRPWLPELVCDPGYVYLVAPAMTLDRPQGPARRVCWRCVVGVVDHVEGHASVDWEDAPAAGERCSRCERSFFATEREKPAALDERARPEGEGAEVDHQRTGT